MSSRYLGHGFEVHAGGMDLIFPHHENEIAQSEAVPGVEGPFVSTWIHNGFVNVDKEKMAKSLGNFVTVRDVYERNDPEALRYFLLSVHYRGPIAFETEKLADGRVVFPGVVEAERRVDYLYQALERLDSLAAGAAAELPAKPARELAPFFEAAKAVGPRVSAALDDDLNTTVAFAAIGEAAKAANELVDLAGKRRKDAGLQAAAPVVGASLARALRGAMEPLGILQAARDVYVERTQARRLRVRGTSVEAIRARLSERDAARAAKDYARGDEIRKALEAEGIEVADSPSGTTFRIAP
jgi:cysteinyl-tRNA synthetase